MTVYLTKVWGFREPAPPLTFSELKKREEAQRKLKSGDIVVLVGTTGEPTKKEERGRILGIMEPTIDPVMTLDFDIPHREHDYDKDGNFKWPYALFNKRAWKIINPPLLAQISNRHFEGYESVKGIVPLTDEEAAKIINLRKEEVQLLTPTIRARARIEGHATARKKSSPPPTTKRNGVMHMRRAPAYTYVMEIIGTKDSAFKIGWAFDYEVRQRQFNQSSMPEIGGLQYKTILHNLFNTAREAYDMEQRLLKHFDKKRHKSNHEIIHKVTLDELRSTWINHIKR